MSSAGGHLGIRIGTKVTTLVKDLDRNIHARFGFNPFIGFQEETMHLYVFPIGSYVKLSPPLGAILEFGSAPK